MELTSGDLRAPAMTDGLIPLVIVGAGGFGREVLELVRDINAAAPAFEFLGFLDDGQANHELLERVGAKALGGSARLADLEASFVIAIGAPGPRRRIDALARSRGRAAATLVHPGATVGTDVQVGEGSIVAAGTRLTTHVVVGRHVHVNFNCTVGHDAVIGDFATVFPGVHVSGGCVIEEAATLGTGCVILPNVRVGRGAVVGAGAIVVRDVEPDATVVGPVARPTLGTRRMENLSADDVAAAVAVPAAQAVGKVRLLDTHAPEWSQFLRETPHDFYHLPAYVALSAAHERGEAVALCVEASHRSLLLPLILRSIPGSDRRDATSPYGYPGPLVSGADDPAFMSEALTAGLDTLRSEGIVSAFVRFHPLLNTAVPEGVSTVVLHGDTISIDLTQPPEVLWAQTRRNHRRDITRAIQSGLSARIDPGFERYSAFKRLYRVTMDRLEAAPYYYFDDDYFDGLRDALGERLHLCVVEDGDVVVAAGLLVETGGIVQYHLMGIAEAFAHAEPSKLMVHFAREWARERGNRYLHLGGGVGGADDSLLHFKAGFSPLRFPFRTLRIVLDQAEYRRLVAAHHPSLDPDILGGFFPAYRAE